MWIAEVDRHTQCVLHIEMVLELSTVIIGDRFTSRLWEAPQDPNNRLARFVRRFGLQGGGDDEPGLPLTKRQ